MENFKFKNVRLIALMLALILAMTACSSKVRVHETVSEDGVTLSDDSSDFALLSEAVPDAILEIRYYSTYNFVGERIDGYEEPLALLTKEAAVALKEASDELLTMGFRLKIFDAYRPQMAVTHFMNWAMDPDDVRMKEYFYPELEKDVLFPQGYIAEHSGHSRGSTVDLTLFDMKTEREVDMGGTFDYFGELSHPDYTGITPEQYANRMILREVMLKHGFKPLAEEWWHFTLENEPYPDTYFTFPINSDSITSAYTPPQPSAATAVQQPLNSNGITSNADSENILEASTAEETAAEASALGAFWTEGSTTAQTLSAYVAAATDEDSETFIPEEDRIAVFDLDGTLMCETCPWCFEYMVFADYVLNGPGGDAEAQATAREILDSAWGEKPANMSTRQAAAGARAYAGITPEELTDYVKAFRSTAADGFSGMTRGEAWYQPMLEVVSFLQDNGFTIYIVTATERNIVRGIVDGVLQIPPSHVIGTCTVKDLEASTYATPDALGGYPQTFGIEFTLDTTKAYDQGAIYPQSTYYQDQAW